MGASKGLWNGLLINGEILFRINNKSGFRAIKKGYSP